MAGNRVRDILMTRDGMTKEEADARIVEVREMMDEAVADGEVGEAEAIFEEEFCLEPDYLIDIL
jgi:hypothetical protein